MPQRFPQHTVIWRYPYEHGLPIQARTFFMREQWKKYSKVEQSRTVYRRPGYIWAVPLDSIQGLQDRFDGT